MRRTMLLLSGMTLAVAAGRTLVAQTLPIPVGARVRVMTTNFKKPVIGVAKAVSDTTISIASDSTTTTTIPIRTITHADVSTGRRRPAWSKTAPLWLTGAGALVGAAVSSASTPSDDILGPEFNAAAGGIAGGFVGLVLGIVIAVEVVNDTWEPVVRGVSQRSSPVPTPYVAPRGSQLSFGLHATF